MNLSEMSDAALMQSIIRREERAFSALYDRYGARMYRFFLRMFRRDAVQAEDFTQELFLRIWEKAGYYDPEKSFRTWLYSLAYNLCKNEFRRLTRPVVSPPPEEDWEDNVLEQLDRELFEQQLQASILLLSPAQHECFVLRYQEALSVPEIADILGCPEGTVKSRLYHALRQVCTQMENWTYYERKN